MNPRHATRSDRGTTLLEAMISITILAIGILGMMQLQILGITSNAGARASTQAYQLARELSAALGALSPGDPLLAAQFTSDAPPATFGHLLLDRATVASTGFTAWTDTMALGGVTTDVSVIGLGGTDPDNSALPRFQRRWQVWQMPTAASVASGGVNLVAVSVIYSEPKLPGLREVVLLSEVSNHGLGASFVAAYR